jgi:prepilin-type N-terminal cleavage/methylation domain-containing protein
MTIKSWCLCGLVAGRKMKKAFTLIELVVAVALLTMVVSFASVIFKVSIDAHRTASANAEIMEKLRAITDQLNADFKGIRRDAPLLIWFQQDKNIDDPNRYDQIMFFADGDFQSTQLYDGPAGSQIPSPTGDHVVGNIARVFYGQAQIPDPNGGGNKEPFELDKEERILARRQHILTADEDLDNWPDASDVNESFNAPSEDAENELYEHDRLSLSQWKTIQGSSYDAITNTCFGFRPWIDMDDPNTFHKLMCEEVGSFAIQWAYPDDELRWFPSNDPDGDPLTSDSHFGLIGEGEDEFGVYFNIPGSADLTVQKWYFIDDSKFNGTPFKRYPTALKFTFKLYDSKEILEGGRTYTHIVYLGD